MAGIAIAYTQQLGGSQSWNIVLEQFTTPDFPRSYSNAVSWQRTSAGSLAMTGPRFPQKYIWTIDCIILTEEALKLDQLYQAWDYDRSFGLSVACGVLDKTWGPDLTANAGFTVAPSYTYAAGNTIVSFGLQQV